MHMLPSLATQVPTRSPAESDAHYPVVAQLNDRWRIIICRDGIQWILQRRHGLGDPASTATTRWDGRSYCRAKAALIRCCREYCGPIEPAAATVLAALPAWIGGDL